ncbi:mitogen-activated protein kinase kinase kinase 4-like [Aphidius gifuensis]|uniref:mitogen-activated protein kinase kinase kinase 4-like n=1 Tax=Aphidius gifuensis TaxID=684658 RepID=UPI001CDD5E9E|nr:mitogen-activated protein kinase kinase kinase 4-like [Aphidius gifuensis]
MMETNDTDETLTSNDCSDYHESFDDLIDIYGRTPPREKVNRKLRVKGKNKKEKRRISRMQACDQESRQCKRLLKLNRVNERDSKLDIEAANQYIQGKNRFLSLRSKLVEIDQPKSSKEIYIYPKINSLNDDQSKIISPNDRELFHLTFSQLINLGNKDKDKGYQRDEEKIRWQNEIKDLIWLELQAYHSDRNLIEQDEYLCRQRETIGSLLNEIMEYKYDPSSSCTSDNSVSNDSGYNDESKSSCTGCLSMYCYHCGKSQITALKQVESLLLRLEEAESLYPNSQAFSLDYELYKSKKFCDKIKAICLWYNITKYHRFKLHILGRLFTKREQNSLDINNNDEKYLKSFIPLTPDESSFKEFDRQSYRKYIEEVLKTQGLTKSLNFLDRLYNTILQKTNLTLKKLNNSIDYYVNNDNWESQRYGVWSIEAKELNLPSYVSSFIFLSRVPLDVVHEYLRLRLEQKLINLEPLSIRELMREIKEGIGIACMHRDKFVENSKIVLSLDESFHESLDTIPPDFQDVGEFDNNLKLVFEVYLNYFGNWIGIVLNNNICYKSIDTEWIFVKNITSKIKNGYNICGAKFCKIINTIIKEINEYSKVFDTNEQDFNIIKIRLRQIFHQAFRMGFNYYKGLSDLFSLNDRFSIAYDLTNFAKLWMNFVIERCDRGRGIRPGWAYDGFKFLTIVCDPSNTKHLHDDDFENFKTAMDCCITHIIGDNDSNIESPICLSPSVQSSIKSCNNVKSPVDATTNNKRLNSSSIDDNTTGEFDSTTMSQRSFKKHKKIMISLNKLDMEIDENKKKYGLIGHSVDSVDRKNINDIKFKIKKITFSWHRGICIGQGAFGKVYTVVNNKTGKLLAMKEIQLQYGNRNSVNNVIKELQIFQGIEHKNLVRYYGMEIHREELLIFMELCPEGTLENLIKAHGTKLLDVFVRKYTHQLVLGVSVLHEHGIVHRDIKTANIFLTNQGNCLKLGDFGSAVKINTHVTMPGEIKGCVGTEAYMAPEVFMKNDSGRAADIWSIGCCVIEMSSGKRPWNDYNTRGQIMFKVGMGENPKIPDNITNDEVDFLHKCLQRNPKDRPTANALLSHMFIRNFGDIHIE